VEDEQIQFKNIQVTEGCEIFVENITRLKQPDIRDIEEGEGHGVTG
jgi:hypothetical protein